VKSKNVTIASSFAEINLTDISSILNEQECILNISITGLSCTICEYGAKMSYKLVVTTDYGARDKEVNVSYYATNIYGKVLFFRNTTFRDFVSRKTKARQLTPNFENEVIFLHANITSASCKIKDGSKLYDNATIFILKSSEASAEQEGKAFVKILELDKNSASFGDILKVRINASRGDEASYALYIFIENKANGYDASEKYTIYLKEKNKVYEITLPIQIKPNCNNRLKDGMYVVVAQLGIKNIASDKRDILLKGRNPDLCRKVVYYSSSSSRETKSKDVYSLKDNKTLSMIVNLSTECIYRNASSISITLFNPHNSALNGTLYYEFDDDLVKVKDVNLQPKSSMSISVPLKLSGLELDEARDLSIIFHAGAVKQRAKIMICKDVVALSPKNSHKETEYTQVSSITGKMTTHVSGLLMHIKRFFIKFIYAVFS
jgi:hypothetical protein